MWYNNFDTVSKMFIFNPSRTNLLLVIQEALRIQTELALRVRSLEVELQRVHEEALVMAAAQTSPPPSPGVPDLSGQVNQLESM